jgi:DNA-directed RNA polymerase specialized sigma24 family protein
MSSELPASPAMTPAAPTPLMLLLADPAFVEPYLGWTLKRIESPEDAEDLVGAARLRAIEREASGDGWDPGGGVSAGLYFLKIIKCLYANRRQLAANDHEELLEDPDVVASETVSPADEVAERLEANQRRRLANELHRSLVDSGKDPVAVAILEAVADGVTGHIEIAARTGYAIEAVRLGFKRLSVYGQASIDAFRQQARFQ